MGLIAIGVELSWIGTDGNADIELPDHFSRAHTQR